MKNKLKILGLCLIASLQLNAGQDGNGGDGVALLFTELAYHTHAVLQEDADQNGMHPILKNYSVEDFKSVIGSTKVISTPNRLFDNHGHEVTARFLTPKDLRIIWSSEGISQEDIQYRLNQFPSGVIEISRPRFFEEIQFGWELNLKFNFHEYMRAMAINDNNYVFTADTSENQVFKKVFAKMSPEQKAKWTRSVQYEFYNKPLELPLLETEIDRWLEGLRSRSTGSGYRIESSNKFISY